MGQKVSVIIPTYNRAAVLGRALASVLEQTVPAGEIIVVDDGSTDNTADLLANDFSGVVYLSCPQRGVSAARNLGINASRGEWLAFLDSDDEWLPEKLETQLTRLMQSPACSICHTEEIWVRNGKRVNQMNKHGKSGGWIFRKCLPLCAMSPSSVMLHRSVLDDVGGFDESLPACEDYDLWLRITHRFPVEFVEQPMIRKYGGHADQLSRRHWGMDRFRIRALEKLLNSADLSAGDRQAASEMLASKATIFSQGAAKRGRQQAAAHYAALADYYRHAADNPGSAKNSRGEMP